MNLPNFVFVAAVSLFIAGCASSWESLDNRAVTPERIKQAKTKCKYEQTVIKLGAREASTQARILATSDETKKQSLRAEYEAAEKKAYAGLNRCMAGQGLRPKN